MPLTGGGVLSVRFVCTTHLLSAIMRTSFWALAVVTLLSCARATGGGTDASIAAGKALYVEHCTLCHGLDGSPNRGGTFDLRDYSRSFERFDSALDIGPGEMHRFPELDRHRRLALYDYV